MLSYRILIEAEKDLDEHAFHIAKDNLNAALRLYDAAKETYRMLSEQAKMGECYPSQNSLLSNIRFFPIKGFKKYLVFYRPSGEEIEIIRILHISRNIKNILS
ncbi:type II toxin-antitoxin system RelE/ParE family toxin [Nitrospira defluvii]|nr:type II toxin-antitoxin system RelE/ParE family toxin [Nitrospira defluvii]